MDCPPGWVEGRRGPPGGDEGVGGAAGQGGGKGKPIATVNIMIKFRNLEKFYESGAGRTYVLRQINIEIQEGEFVTIMGPSGAGNRSDEQHDSVELCRRHGIPQ